ncbi:unnamed protein product [Amoebophrya sp. A25]|nr:unnamed protein product [Amoebophrya sp. A25]|eukprot:GSA25T00013705001.1
MPPSFLAQSAIEFVLVPATFLLPVGVYLFTDYIDDFVQAVPGILRAPSTGGALEEVSAGVDARPIPHGESESSKKILDVGMPSTSEGPLSWWTLPASIVLFVVYSIYLRAGRADYVAQKCSGIKTE